MTRYAAKLLFQFRVEIAGGSGQRRICEERIINFQARTHREALSIARRRGRRAEHSYRNADGNPVHIEFVGIMDIMTIGIEAGADEVWYDIYERITPMERRDQILPTAEALQARLDWGGSGR